jgi:hypothetical protein
MKRIILTAATVFSVLLGAISASHSQQVVGSTQLGVAYAELRDITVGWSAKRQIIGQTVYNDKGEKIGKADDIIVAPDKAISYAIVGQPAEANGRKIRSCRGNEGGHQGDAALRIRALTASQAKRDFQRCWITAPNQFRNGDRYD